VAPSDLLRLRSGIEHLLRLGPRAVAEFVLELADAQTALQLLAKYSTITPQMIVVAGGDRFPVHLQEVPDAWCDSGQGKKIAAPEIPASDAA
jgi:hypothetical protein